MIDLLVSVLLCVICAFVAHEGVRVGNEHFRELNMSPNWSAFIGFVFGLTGLTCLLVYGAIKVMIKRMLKH